MNKYEQLWKEANMTSLERFNAGLPQILPYTTDPTHWSNIPVMLSMAEDEFNKLSAIDKNAIILKGVKMYPTINADTKKWWQFWK